MNSRIDPEAVLTWWFSEPVQKHWFEPSADIDREIAERFGVLHRHAAAGDIDDWANSPRSALALVIILDQFSRHLYRGKPEAWACDEQALRAARTAIIRGFDRPLEDREKAFLYMPFMHSERFSDQEESVRLFTVANLDNARYAIGHRDIVRRFGRFPHRNAVLGRDSTAEEQEYLDSEAAFHG